MPDSQIAYSRNGEKARVIARLFEQGRDSDAYAAMEFMLREQAWPAWLSDVAVMIDGPKDRPINAESHHV